MLCRDCCCGTAAKHPGVDHDAQRSTLTTATAGDVRVRVVDCLDECSHSNVVVVREHDRPRGEQDTWLGGVLDPVATAEVVRWVEGGGGPLPALLEALRIDRIVPVPRGSS